MKQVWVSVIIDGLERDAWFDVEGKDIVLGIVGRNEMHKGTTLQDWIELVGEDRILELADQALEPDDMALAKGAKEHALAGESE